VAIRPKNNQSRSQSEKKSEQTDGTGNIHAEQLEDGMSGGFAGASAMTTLFSGQATQSPPAHARSAEVVALFESYRAPLLRYLVTLGMTVHDGEEVIQEVFLALFQHLKKGKRDDNLRGWIFRVGHNLALKHFGSLKFRTEKNSIPLDEIESNAISEAPNPEQALEASRSEARIKAVIGALPELDRRCLYLRAEGLRYREIAEVLNVSLGSVANALERAIGKLDRARGRSGIKA
jgi:RNA polymerase sigma-70 factor (ECF subfamily)